MSLFDPKYREQRTLPKKKIIIAGIVFAFIAFSYHINNPSAIITSTTRFTVYTYEGGTLKLPYKFKMAPHTERTFRLIVRNTGSLPCFIKSEYKKKDDVIIIEKIETGELLPKTTGYVEIIVINPTEWKQRIEMNLKGVGIDEG